MCLAIPAKVVEIQGEIAKVDILGNQTVADISVLEDVEVGSYVLVHAGFAIHKYSHEEGEENLKLIHEVLEKAQNLSS
ncbi:MAG: HypC/HybG/HupF family hydrogenase formation chaperone [Candidatus Brocadiae bacterium]|nr:HypC/HybG/HupF family hydrogenase formation chaperone [Candidatus Brocadiia bacterium]